MSWFSPFSTLFLGRLRTLAWRGAKRWVRQSFPSVPTISTEELAHWLEADSPNPPVLIDARRLEEYRVSHLPNAYHAKTIAEVENLGLSKDAPIVIYCSIGYRSARLAQALRAAGYQAVNLEGSIFQWANEHRALNTFQRSSTHEEAQVTHTVHPYNTFWGLLLEPHCSRPS